MDIDKESQGQKEVKTTERDKLVGKHTYLALPQNLVSEEKKILYDKEAQGMRECKGETSALIGEKDIQV